MTIPKNLEVARKAKLAPLEDIAASIGIGKHLLEPYGEGVAKIKLDAIEELEDRPRAKYVVVSAITPTPLGEGKTTTTVGLGQAFKQIGKTATVAVRQASMGPVFGIKGGAAGGGYSQVVPMEMLNLHLTGDIHAVTAANNLLAAMVDNHIHHHDDFFHVDRHSVTWRRVMDVNDPEGNPITAEDLRAAGSMAVIMKEALKPNLMQTLENTPALVHAGPFGNIATGNSSIVADLIGIRGGDFLITEAGFGADMGAERFFNIKCRYSGLEPDAAVLVATVRALKVHSGRYELRAGKPLPGEMQKENPDDVYAGAANLKKQIENIRLHGVSPVVAINAFPTDYETEYDAIREIAGEMGARVAVCSHFSDGGSGAVELAEAVAEAAEEPSSFRFLYPDEASLREKIETIATKVYGAKDVEYNPQAARMLDSYEDSGFGELPVCMAKTHLSITSDPSLKGAPTGWMLPVREVRASVGAGFVYPICGDMRTMPGLSASPAAEGIDIDENGEIVGLF